MKYAVYCLLGVAFALLFASSITPGVIITPDGKGYLDYADRISDGVPVTAYDNLSLRTPLYPFIIAVSARIVGDAIFGVQIAHVNLLLITIVGCAYILRPLVPYSVSAIATMLGLLPSCIFLNVVLTEWTSVCVTTFLSCCLIRYYHSRDARWARICALLVATGILIRPAMISFIPVIILLVGLLPRWKDRIVSSIFLCAPLLTWMTFHSQLYGTFSISDLGPIAFFGASTIRIHAESSPDDTPDEKKFFDEYNRHKYPRLGSSEQPLSDSGIADRNMWQVAENIRQANGWTYSDLSKLCGTYNQRLLKNNFREIFSRWWSGITMTPQYVGSQFVFCVLSLFYFIYLRKSSRLPRDVVPFLKVLLLMSIFFLLHTSVSAAVHPLIARHFLLGWNAFLSSLIMATAAAVYFSVNKKNDGIIG